MPCGEWRLPCPAALRSATRSSSSLGHSALVCPLGIRPRPPARRVVAFDLRDLALGRAPRRTLVATL